jgi:hypothetical protein
MKNAKIKGTWKCGGLQYLIICSNSLSSCRNKCSIIYWPLFLKKWKIPKHWPFLCDLDLCPSCHFFCICMISTSPYHITLTLYVSVCDSWNIFLICCIAMNHCSWNAMVIYITMVTAHLPVPPSFTFVVNSKNKKIWIWSQIIMSCHLLVSKWSDHQYLVLKQFSFKFKLIQGTM